MTTKIKLYPEQEECVEFALSKHNCILNMSIGFGKTGTALAVAEHLKQTEQYQNILIIVPSSLKRQWTQEIEKFTYSDFKIIEGTPKKRIYNTKEFYKIVGYETARNDIDKIKLINWDLLIVDEIVRIKNRKTKLAKALNKIAAKQKIALSGAILENRIEELYNIINFIRPHIFKNYWDFANRFLVRQLVSRPWGRYFETVGIKNIDSLKTIMKEFVIKKKLTDLPRKEEKTYYVQMTKEQREKYKLVVDECIDQLRYNKNPLAKLTYLREVCDSPQLIGLKGKSNKIEELKEILKEIGDEKVVIFSQFKKFTDLIFNELDKPIFYVNGELKSKEKNDRIEKWKQSKSGILLTTDCLQYGVNLQNANILINLDLPWNPIKLQQRIGRIWRRGQTKGCLIINILSEDSVEERILVMLNQKINIINEVMEDDISRIDLLSDFSRQDLIKILRPKGL